MEDFREIIEACKSGDNRAPEKLYNMLAPKMFGVCLRYARNDDEAKDHLQEGFITVFSKLKDFRHEGSFEGWVRRIMVNISVDHYRKKQPLVFTDNMGHYDSMIREEDILSRLSAEDLVSLIQGLPPKYRMVFNLYVVEGYNHKEIGEKLGISEGTSKSDLSRAREILKNKLRRQSGESIKKGITHHE